MTTPPSAADHLELVDWRQRMDAAFALARAAAASGDPAGGHATWKAARDDLFRTHPQSPLPADDPLRETGLPWFDYDPAYRFSVPVRPAPAETRPVVVGEDGTLELRRSGVVELPDPVGASLDVWSLAQYGGGLFVPLRDGTAGRESYGGGRYLLDTAKGAWLGGHGDEVVLDLNFAYHPSCRYDPRWQCPLAPPGNTVEARVEAGERLAHPA
ncbi:DUF1684 domain-containing protein [Nocardioides sp. AX2bis]|uniref:DUF1684 domain-containing protein n=1 Tax=Nocardioides sp. AX2bis TaxID=2653157 RepID=UPI0012F33516|nr:DUF1684 domain-containing protein [Nocardioides sp. AX2bis]VXB57153.1 conserved hypothetical protein [Nocardioides sp. AX2bis]